jgi:hypothetical protein
MSVYAIKWFYILVFIILYCTGIYTARVLNVNIFAEIGATIVVFSVARGMSAIRHLNWSAESISSLASEGQKMAFRWDTIFAMIGTATNGYSVWLYALAKSVG